MKSLLDVRNLTIKTSSNRAILEDVTFSVAPECLFAVVGASGSGKTIMSRALTRLFSPTVSLAVTGSVLFDGTELLQCSDEVLNGFRTHSIRYILQDPQQALNPVANVRKQMQVSSAAESSDDGRLINVLRSVGLQKELLDLYPHQLSVGMAQRLMIAMALLPNPNFLIADEPTSAVDASLRRELMNLLRSIQKQNGMTILFITHDLSLAREFADYTGIMHEGKMIEYSRSADFFRAPQSAYSRELLNAAPSLPNTKSKSWE